MKTETYSSIADIPHDLITFWQAQTQTAFDQSYVWNRLFEKEVTQNNTHLLVGRTDNDKPVFLLPLESLTTQHGPLRSRQLDSLTNYYSAHFGPIGDLDETPGSSSAPDEIIGSICSYLIETQRDWHVLNWQPMALDGAFFQPLTDALRQCGFAVFPYFKFGNWYLPIEGRCFEEYFATLPSQMRNTLKRKRKKVENDTDFSLQIITNETGLEKALDDYESVYAKSWKIPEPHLGFIREVASAFAQLDWLRLGIAYINNVPAAAQLWFVKDKTAYIFKLAYDETFKDYSVGSLLSAELFRHTMDIDGVQTIDYLCGDDPYKQTWMTHRRERWGMLVCNTHSLPGSLIALRHKAAAALRPLLKKKT